MQGNFLSIIAEHVFSGYCNTFHLFSVTFFSVVVSLPWLCSLCSRYCTDLYVSWTENVCESSQYNLSLPLISRDSVTGLISVNFNQQVFFFLFSFLGSACLTTWPAVKEVHVDIHLFLCSLLGIYTAFIWFHKFSIFCIMLSYAFCFFPPLASLPLYWEKWSTWNSDRVRPSLKLRCISTPPEGSCGSMWPTWRWLWADITRL